MKILTSILALILALGFYTGSTAYAGSITEAHPLPFLSFLRYHVIKSSRDGNICRRVIRLEIKNTSNKKLSGVIATLDSFPNYATSADTKVSFGNMRPSATALSKDTFEISIDMAEHAEPDLGLVWKIECEIAGQHVENETLVVEELD